MHYSLNESNLQSLPLFLPVQATPAGSRRTAKPATTHEIVMATWQVRQCIDPEEAYRFLMLDRIWAGYALCDLESPLWEYSSFYWAEQGNKKALVLHVDLDSLRILSGFGDPEGINAVWSEIRLPLDMQYSFRTEREVEGLQQYYHLESLYPMWRLYLRTSEIVSWDSGIEVVPIGPDRNDELSAIFEGHPECAYVPEQLHTGVFYGVLNNEKLLAVVGTHVLSKKYRIAGVGNAFTLPEVRRKGYFRACLAMVIAQLSEMGIDDIIANVGVDNIPSLNGALALGFKKHCQYWEGVCVGR
jgi:hypothetical protein